MTTANVTLKRSNPNELTARLAGKLLAFIIALMLVVALLTGGVNRAFAASMPRLDVKVKGEQIRLGDVFDGITRNADFVLAPAPAPGEELVWNEPTLLRIATAFNLPWRPQAGSEVRIRRAAMALDAHTLKSVVRDHLASIEEGAVFNVVFTGPVEELIIEGERSPDIQLVDFNMLPTGGTFNATVRVSDETGKHQTVSLRGAAERMVRLPVLKTALKNGDIITENHIGWTTQKASLIRADLVRDTDTLIGATPRRSLQPGEVIRADAIEMPRMVSRGDLITMVHNQNGMFVTARGRALEDGAMGQVIKVSNASSNRILQARVTNPKQVTVNQ